LSADILKYLSVNSWLTLDINQMPGFFLNFEQKIQKFNLIHNTFKFTLLNFILFIKSIIPQTFKINIFKYLYFFNSNNKNLKILNSNSLLIFQYLFECFFSPNKFYLSNFFFNSWFPSFSFFFFNKIPFKLILEDSNRTSLQLKYSVPLIKNSQLLQLHDYLYFI